MDVRTEIKWIHEELDKVTDPTFLEAIKNMLKYRKKVSDEKTNIVAYAIDGKGLTLKQYNQELLDAEVEIAKGEFITQENLEKESENW